MRDLATALVIVQLTLATVCAQQDGSRAVAQDTADHATVLVGPDISTAIIIPAQASQAERFSAGELRNYLQRITGQTLPIQEEQAEPTRGIYVGRTALLARHGVKVDADDPGDEGFVMRTVDEGVLLAGADEIGQVFSAYAFLEDYCGVSWFMRGQLGEVVPQRDRIELPTINRREKPAFAFRSLFSIAGPPGPEGKAELYDWWLKNRLNAGYFKSTPPAWFPHLVKFFEDRGIPVAKLPNRLWAGHNFLRIVPPAEHFKSHPDWFPLIGGVRTTPRRGQLCVSNSELIDFVSQRICQLFEEFPYMNIMSLCPEDNHLGWCECDGCRGLDAQVSPDRPFPVYTDRLIWFTNQVARRVAKVHPKKLIYTYAYTWSYTAPPVAVKPDDNVRIELCYYYPSQCDQMVAIDDPGSTANRQFRRIAEGWRALTDELVIRDYNDNIGGLMFPAYGAYAANTRYYQRLGVKGIEYESDDCWGALNPKTWMLAKLMWNPGQDDGELLQRYCAGYFGPAGHIMRQFYLDLESAAARSGVRADVAGSHAYEEQAGLIFTAEVIAAARRQLSAARDAIGHDATLLRRLDIVAAALDWTEYRIALVQSGAYRVEVDGEGLSYTFDRAMHDRGTQVIGALNKVGHMVSHYYKAPSVPQKDQVTYRTCRLENNKIVLAVAPEIGMICQLRSKEHNAELTYLDPSGIAGGGLAEVYRLADTMAGGRGTAYEVIAQAPDEIHLRHVVPDQIQIDRIIRLAGDRVEFKSSVTNLSQQTRQARLMVHPFLAIGGTIRNNALWLQDASGWRCIDFQGKDDVSTYLWGERLPAAWAIGNPDAGVGLVQQMTAPGSIEYLLLWNNRGRFYTFETHTRPVDLAAGQTMSFAYAYQLVPTTALNER